MRTLGRAGRGDGYTLPEVAVMMVIGVVVMAIGFPEMSRAVRRARLEEAAGKMESVLRVAREKALAHRTHYRVFLTPASGTYAVEFEDSAGAWQSDFDSLYVMPDGIRYEGTKNGTAFGPDIVSPADLLFEPRGTLAFRDAPLEVLMYNERGDTIEMEMVRTGRVRSWRR